MGVEARRQADWMHLEKCEATLSSFNGSGCFPVSVSLLFVQLDPDQFYVYYISSSQNKERHMNKKMKKKSLCKWDKDDVKKNRDELYELIGRSKFVCEKCLRSSKLEDTLCKPAKLA
jgi:hypothetical protein